MACAALQLACGAGTLAQHRSCGLRQVLGAGHPLEAFFLDTQVKAVSSEPCMLCCMLRQSPY